MPKTYSTFTRFARYKFYVQGGFYHIYNRGNGKENIFVDDKDYYGYLRRVKEAKEKREVDLLCYSLMANHVHLLVYQRSDQPIYKFISSLHTSYAIYFNRKYNHIGHLFQDRFKQVLIESDEQLIHLSRYIHLNPVMAGLCRKPEDYLWSSYREYLGRGGELCLKEKILNFFNKKDSQKDYQQFVESQLKEMDIDKIKEIILEPS